MLTGGSSCILGKQMDYTKPSLSYEEQADLVIARGMICDREDLVNHLRDVGYYRLSGYWHGFRREDDMFVEGTCFSTVWERYAFDRQFRLLVFDAIERVEVSLRTKLAYELSREGGPFGYLSPDNLPRLKPVQYDRFIHTCRDKIERSREPFVEHFLNQYGDCHDLPPYWMIVNTMDFGQVLTLYRGAPAEVRGGIADELGLSARVLESWLVSLNTVRNICAHHGRLWNRVIGTKPAIPNAKRDGRWHEPYAVDPNRVFCIVTILSFLLEKVAPQTKWRDRMLDLFNRYPAVPKEDMGFTSGWQRCPLWSAWVKPATDA